MNSKRETARSGKLLSISVCVVNKNERRENRWVVVRAPRNFLGSEFGDQYRLLLSSLFVYFFI